MRFVDRRIGRVVFGLVSCWAVAPAVGDDWPKWRGPEADGVWRETGIIARFDGATLPAAWRAEVAGGYSGPTVADGRVYVTDRVVKPKQVERVHCFDAATGRRIWSYEYDCPYRDVSYDTGPRASVTVDDGRAYSLGTMGHIFCFDAATGEVLWKKDLKKLYKIRMPIWGIAAAPLVENELVIVHIGGDNGACVVAFDKKTGREKWKALDDNASYSTPIAIDQAGKRVIVVWTGENVVGLNPENGQVHWKHPYERKRMIIGISTPVLYKDMLFVTGFFDGSMMLRLRQDEMAVDLVWRKSGSDEQHTESLHSIISTPIIFDDHIYGVDSYGELRCLNALTGDRIWESLAAVPRARWATIHFVRHDNEVWMFNERGELIISKLSPAGFDEISRAKLIEPTMGQLPRRGGVCWTHPAFANRHVFVRNDKELICANLAAK